MQTKFLNVLTLSLVLCASASASTPMIRSQQAKCPMTRTCQSPELIKAIGSASGSAQGFIVEFGTAEDGSTTAVLEELAISKEQKTRTYRSLGELRCKDLNTQPAPDEPRAVAICKNPNVADSGYVLEVMSPDFAGVQRARLFEERFTGRIPAGTLNCKLTP